MLFGLFGKRRGRSEAVAGAPAEGSRDELLAQAHLHAGRGHFGAAEVCLERLLAESPDDPELHNQLGLIHYANNAFAEAERAFREALRRAPDHPAAMTNLGQSLQARGDFANARQWFTAALKVAPRDATARFNLAVASYGTGDTAAATAILETLIAEAPAAPSPHIALGECLLKLERFSRGWVEYEWRLRADKRETAFREGTQPAWNGAAIDGASVLIWPEQGYGDMLQFMRLVRVAANRAARTRFILELPRALSGIAEFSFRDCGNVTVVASGEQVEAFTHHASLMSLPHLLQADLTENPVRGPYLEAMPADVERWRAPVAEFGRQALKVGVVWAGNQRAGMDASERAMDLRRSIGAARFSGVLDVPGCAFFSLQVGTRAGELAGTGRRIADFSAELTDFAATAGLIANLDLVITVDTSVAHLAGALGKPVWMLSRFDCCWRWGDRRADIPWYPGMRPFYQPESGAWQPVIETVARALAELAAGRR